jgi:hypothetical protein
MELFEAVRANPDDVGFCAQFDQAVQDVVEATAALQALEVEWGFVAPAPTLIAPLPHV